jgi:hypothetical protein
MKCLVCDKDMGIDISLCVSCGALLGGRKRRSQSEAGRWPRFLWVTGAFLACLIIALIVILTGDKEAI